MIEMINNNFQRENVIQWQKKQKEELYNQRFSEQYALKIIRKDMEIFKKEAEIKMMIAWDKRTKELLKEAGVLEAENDIVFFPSILNKK